LLGDSTPAPPPTRFIDVITQPVLLRSSSDPSCDYTSTCAIPLDCPQAFLTAYATACNQFSSYTDYVPLTGTCFLDQDVNGASIYVCQTGPDPITDLVNTRLHNYPSLNNESHIQLIYAYNFRNLRANEWDMAEPAMADLNIDATVTISASTVNQIMSSFSYQAIKNKNGVTTTAILEVLPLTTCALLLLFTMLT